MSNQDTLSIECNNVENLVEKIERSVPEENLSNEQERILSIRNSCAKMHLTSRREPLEANL